MIVRHFIRYKALNTEYVDLGLSVKLATCNIGANKPEEYGYYLAWGETEPKDYYDFSTYKWCRGTILTLIKYNINSSYGTVDNKTTLDLSDDAASANWGGSWRMPTDAELTELREQCTWTWTTQNGVYGYNVTSNKNGNSIFLPAAGHLVNNTIVNESSFGEYISSSLYTDGPTCSMGLTFNRKDIFKSTPSRYNGYTIRPVTN